MTGSGKRVRPLPEGIESYEGALRTFEKSRGAGMVSWMEPIRKSALDKFRKTGFPTSKLEDWKYTNVTPFVRSPFQFSFEPLANGLDEKKISSLLLGGKGGPVLVFVNGLFSEKHSNVFPSPLPLSPEGRGQGEGVKAPVPLVALSLAEALEKDPDLVKRYLTQIAPFEQNGFTALNAAFIRDGAFIHLPEGKISEKPIHLIFISLPSVDNLLIQPRNLIVLEKGSRATLIETYISFSERPYFTNAVTEVVVGEAASLNHLKIQRESSQGAGHVAGIEARVEKLGRYNSFSLSLGARLDRENLNVLLAAEGAECSLDGLYLVSHGRHVDHHTVIDHQRPLGTSRQLYKGILTGKSTAVFNGKVFVRREAPKSDATQTNKNILLSKEAVVDTKPQLEIDTDDVKCTHGAAVGQLDPDQLFYLRSRGIGEGEARDILTRGFASEVIDRFEDEAVRARLTELVWDWLEKERAGKVPA